MPYGFYITNRGRELLTSSTATTDKVTITKACFGDGGDLVSQPELGITELKNQIYEKTFEPGIDSYKVSDSDLSQLEIKTILPEEVTGTINEIGYRDDKGNLIIYGTVKELTKEQGVEIQYENWIKLETGDAEKIEINIISPEIEEISGLINDLTQRVGAIENDLDGFLEILKETVGDGKV